MTFVRQKLDAAKWFIDAIKQRQQTLMATMQAIIDYQKAYFLNGGDEALLVPTSTTGYSLSPNVGRPPPPPPHEQSSSAEAANIKNLFLFIMILFS